MKKKFPMMVSIKKHIFLDLFERFACFSTAIAKQLASMLQDSRPNLNLPSYDTSKKPDYKTLRLLPRAFMLRHRVLPVENVAARLTIAFVDTFNPSLTLRIEDLFLI